MVVSIIDDDHIHPPSNHPSNTSTTPKLNYFENGYNAVMESILPLLRKLVSGVNQDARRAASDSIAGMAPYMFPHCVIHKLLPIATHLLTKQQENGHKNHSGSFTVEYAVNNVNANVEDLRIASATILSELSKALPTDTLHNVAIPNLLTLSQHSTF